MKEEFKLSEKRHDFRLINMFMYEEKDVKEFIKRDKENLYLFLAGKIEFGYSKNYRGILPNA